MQTPGKWFAFLFYLGAVVSRRVRDDLLGAIFDNDDPVRHANLSLVDRAYPHTNLSPKLVKALLDAHEQVHGSAVDFWLECGSMLGGSIIRTAGASSHLPNITLVAMDPFVGDVNMWDWEKKLRAEKHRRNGHGFLFLDIRHGQPTIWDRFLANTAAAGLAGQLVPLRLTATVGLRLLLRLHAKRRLSRLPQVIYLDSAHEQGETLHELGAAWAALPPRCRALGGVCNAT